MQELLVRKIVIIGSRVIGVPCASKEKEFKMTLTTLRTLDAFNARIVIFAVAALYASRCVAAADPPAGAQERVVQWTIESRTTYVDPFNDVDVDVIFRKDGQSWRVPTYWRGGQKWTVRFAPPSPGEYAYHLESTDSSNPDLNGHEGRVTIRAYSGSKGILRHGAIRVSANHRYFEHADGTPFYWLGDTWWTGLSDRLSWEGFQKLTADRKAKGFTVVQIVAGLIPSEELAPSDPGYCNEGGCVWDPAFKRINPRYFDSADRRIQHLVANEIAPAIVGAWSPDLATMGIEKMKKHWRYVIARYGAYPVFWILGGEVFDPPEGVRSPCDSAVSRGWTDVARYLREMDPYHHPMTVHEAFLGRPCGVPLQDESVTDFDLLQAGHSSWMSLAASVTEIGRHYARTSLIKPVVQGEIGYEHFIGAHWDDFQRAAFWLSMLNGAAGHTYGAAGTWESYSAEKPFQRVHLSFMTWDEGMNLPGSYQVGLGAKLLRAYPWWRFTPHPEWVTPRGTTLLNPRDAAERFDPNSWELAGTTYDFDNVPTRDNPGGSAGKASKHNFHRPYAAGIPREVRVIYMPYQSLGITALMDQPPPTVLGLEPGVRYQAYFWEPSVGMRIDLGVLERPPPGPKLFEDTFTEKQLSAWDNHGPDTASRTSGTLAAHGEILTTLREVREADAIVAADVESQAQAALVLRYQDADNYVAAVYAPGERALYLLDRQKGKDGAPLGRTALGRLGGRIRLSTEVREDKAVASVTDGQHIYTTPIIDIGNAAAGSAGVMHRGSEGTQHFANFELRRSPVLVKDESLPRKLYDAKGVYRGELVGEGMSMGEWKKPGWSDFGRDKHIMLDAYRPEQMPAPGDWLLVLEAK